MDNKDNAPGRPTPENGGEVDFDALEEIADQLQNTLDQLKKEFEEVKKILQRGPQDAKTPDDRDECSRGPFGWALAI